MKEKINYENKIIYSNSVLSMIYKVVSAGLSFLLAPLLLHCLGEEKYGAWVAVLSLVSWVYYFDLGIGNGLRNKLANDLALDDYTSARKNLGISYILISGISIIICIVAFISIYLLKINSFLNIEFSDENVKTALAIAVIFACLNFVCSLANNILFALQKAGLVNLFSVVAQVMFVILLIIYAFTGVKQILFVALGEGVCQLIKNIYETVYVFKSNPELRFGFKDIDKEYSNGILSFGLQMFLIQMAALVLNSTDNLVITKLYGAAAVTPYSFCYKYFSMINSFYVALITPLLSAYTAAYARKDSKWIIAALRKNCIVYIVFVLGTVIATVIFKPFSFFWLQKELIFERGMIISTSIYFILLMFNHIFSTFITGIGRVKETTVMTIVCTFINIPISVFLAKVVGLGSTGVILGTLICAVIGIWVGPYVAYREIKKLD